jgi:hypothetical protein
MIPGALALPSAKLPAVRVEPLVKVIVPVLALVVPPPRITAPDTVSDGVAPLNVSAPVPVVELPVRPNWRLEQAAPVMSTVTLWFLLMTTASAEVGGPFPAVPLSEVAQVLVALQLPFATE